MQNKLSFTVDIIDGTVIISPQEHKYTLIWLPGLKQQPSQFIDMFLTQPIVDSITNFRVVIPRAPYRKYSLEPELVLSWYDIKHRNSDTFSRPTNEGFNYEEIEDSRIIIEGIVHKELELLGDQSRVFLGGFSQGCAMSLHVAYSLKMKLGGVISVAGYMFNETQYDADAKFPLRVFHGLADLLRPWEQVKISYEKRNCPVKLIEEMGHTFRNKSIRREIFNTINEFIMN